MNHKINLVLHFDQIPAPGMVAGGKGECTT